VAKFHDDRLRELEDLTLKERKQKDSSSKKPPVATIPGGITRKLTSVEKC